jgi:preprotein translocase subunit SecG
MDTFLGLVGMFISVVLIGIILLQRGRGGGLVGALSGLGGQSAFGTKAGDTFTRITIGIAAAWVILAGVHGQVLRSNIENKASGLPERIEAPKEKEPSVSAKTGDSKAGSGIGTPLSDEGDEIGKDEDLKKKPKTVKSATEETPGDVKNAESEAKPSDSKEEAKPKEDAKKEDESK